MRQVRIDILVTMILTMIALQLVLTDAMPHIDYVTWLRLFLGRCVSLATRTRVALVFLLLVSPQHTPCNAAACVLRHSRTRDSASSVCLLSPSQRERRVARLS